MRPDRFITLNLVQPLRCGLTRLRNSGASALGDRLPVLMYHSISDDPEPGVRPYYRVCTTPQRFREQMQCLKDHGYCGVTLSAGLARLPSASAVGGSEFAVRCSSPAPVNHQPSPPLALSLEPSALRPRPVALTFDDGFRDFYTAAWPILREFGFSATMYLPTAFIGNPRRHFTPSRSSLPLAHPAMRAGAPPTDADNPASRGCRPCLTWTEVRELHAAGIEFGSHTVNHPQLYELDPSQLRAELAVSKATIENELGRPVHTFAYPYAFPSTDRAFVQLFVASLQAAGYHSNVTTRIGRAAENDDPFTLRRLPVNSADDEALFLAKLSGAYDWLAWPQESLKTMKRVVSRRRRCGRPAPDL